MEAISAGWDGGHTQSSSTFLDKIVNCRRAISRWRKEQVPFGRDTIEALKSQLVVAQADDATPLSVISYLNARLREAYRDEEVYWYLKNRNRWMRVEDQNSKYFHALTKQRRARNRITGIFDKNKVWSTEDVDICNTAVSYFADLFTTLHPTNFDEVLCEVRTAITNEVNTQLTAPVTEIEVHAALFMMHPDKALGPDGMTALFYQKAWLVVKGDFVSLVAKPTRMTELRPISLCNVGYKIISKIMCQRLKKILPGLISETQSAFVSGRLISDNILIAQKMFHGLRTNPSCKRKFMAIKTYMSKAYDRVEWGFIEKLLYKMGFDARWIGWIMFCVSSVEYKVLLNGQPNGLIIPERGLRQGDPLSPYLFILCTEVLIANIRKAEENKLITGIKVANQCPPITNLLFADDSLFFCKVAKEQCEVILSILRKYEAASGQQINFAKSSIQFGHKVAEDTKTEIQGILGITNLGGMGSYLGLPESLGGSKTKVFSFVRERLQGRTTGWSAKLLSKGGKKVMIKSIATCGPDVCDVLFSATKDNYIQTHQCCGEFLVEYGWVFKGRYYRNLDPMEPIRSYSPSYGWRSIVSARSVVHKGLIKRVGSGESISIWTVPWIPAPSPRPTLSKGPFKDPSLKISHLIDCQTNSWRMDVLSEHFDPVDVALIGALPLGSCPNEDSLGWHFTKNGRYTVKSGYHAARMTISGPFKALGDGLEITSLLASVWKVRCPPKLHHFMWQAFSGCIPVSRNLRRRGIACDLGCSRCGAEEETVNHVLFLCPPARQMWALSQIPVGPHCFPVESVYANMDHFLDPKSPGSHVSAFPWILWYLWKARNAKVFENITERPEEVVWVAEGEALSWQQAQEEGEAVVSTVQPTVADSRLRGPNTSLPMFFSGYRCFVDGSWKSGDLFAGVGWFCTQSQDPTRSMGATNFRRSLTPLHAELEAFIWAMRCIIGHDYRDVAFYSDCADLVKMVSSPHD
ncbi:PREDICTED: uncharacterized protein LOC104709359 [Camelina sativa]|uniref:Uncharacterized protein LOC104709359 n=1 Tax=Camelina sativa TaxID=90675 RepID=A0ABM0TCP7_CAMSA|nr:PREDICTED: uncharacterized protein LOC104709359 [Camelina sativa]